MDGAEADLRGRFAPLGEVSTERGSDAPQTTSAAPAPLMKPAGASEWQPLSNGYGGGDEHV
jgi:hypothetical protein